MARALVGPSLSESILAASYLFTASIGNFICTSMTEMRFASYHDPNHSFEHELAAVLSCPQNPLPTLTVDPGPGSLVGNMGSR